MCKWFFRSLFCVISVACIKAIAIPKSRFKIISLIFELQYYNFNANINWIVLNIMYESVKYFKLFVFINGIHVQHIIIILYYYSIIALLLYDSCWYHNILIGFNNIYVKNKKTRFRYISFTSYFYYISKSIADKMLISMRSLKDGLKSLISWNTLKLSFKRDNICNKIYLKNKN